MASTVPDRLATRLESGGPASGKAARGRLLVVNVKGFFRADPLYRELAGLGWDTTVLDITEPALLRWLGLARSFHPNLVRWRRRVERAPHSPSPDPLSLQDKRRP